MSSDTRKTRHWVSPMHQPTDEAPSEPPGHVTLVPCFSCDGTGMVEAEVRAKQREDAGFPASSLPADRHEGKKP